MKSLVSFVVALSLLLPIAASAADKLYVIGAVGMTNYNESIIDVDSTSFRIGVGAPFKGNPNIAVEGYYINYGSGDQSFSGPGGTASLCLPEEGK